MVMEVGDKDWSEAALGAIPGLASSQHTEPAGSKAGRPGSESALAPARPVVRLRRPAIPALPATSCVTLSESLHLSLPVSSPTSHKVLSAPREVLSRKHLAECLARSKQCM